MKNSIKQVVMGHKLYDIKERPEAPKQICSDCRLTEAQAGKTQCKGCENLIIQRNLYDIPKSNALCSS
jgi:hypothetical protein